MHQAYTITLRPTATSSSGIALAFDTASQTQAPIAGSLLTCQDGDVLDFVLTNRVLTQFVHLTLTVYFGRHGQRRQHELTMQPGERHAHRLMCRGGKTGKVFVARAALGSTQAEDLVIVGVLLVRPEVDELATDQHTPLWLQNVLAGNHDVQRWLWAQHVASGPAAGWFRYGVTPAGRQALNSWKMLSLASFNSLEPVRYGDLLGMQPATTLAPTSLPTELTSRYLTAQAQPNVSLNTRFTLRVWVAAQQVAPAAGTGQAAIGAFQGMLDLDVVADGFELVSDSFQSLAVPATGDSAQVRFVLKAIKEGAHTIRVTAYNGAAQVAGLQVSVQVGTTELPATPPPTDLTVTAGVIMRDPAPGEAILTVRFNKQTNCYDYRLRRVSIPDLQASSNLLTQHPQDILQELINDLNALARNPTRLGDSIIADRLRALGKQLYRRLIPQELQHALWQSLCQQPTIRRLTIVSPADELPWELLYVLRPDPEPTEPLGEESVPADGFLVDLTTLVRWLDGSEAPALQLSRAPAYVIIPDGAPANTDDELQFVAEALGGASRISLMRELLDKLYQIPGSFNWLHFASHNIAAPGGQAQLHVPPYVPFGAARFDLTYLGNVRPNAYRQCQPVVFMNACTSAGSTPFLTDTVGWASNYLQLGVAAFVGSCWEIRTVTAGLFAKAFYEALKAGHTLGEAMRAGRKAIPQGESDPTRFAYTLYGNPDARLRPDGSQSSS